jgi:hypothetical protein
VNSHPLTFEPGDPLGDARSRLDPLRIDLNWVYLHRSLFPQVVDGLDRDSPNPPPSQTWRVHYAHMYVQTQSAAIRRLIGGPGSRADESCLHRVLTIVHDNAEAITIDRLSKMHALATPSQSTDTEVATRFAVAIEREWGNGSGTIDRAKVEADLSTLQHDTDAVRKWATKTVAHLDPDRPASPTFGELHKAIDDATTVFRDYGRLLTSIDYAVDGLEVDPGWWIPLRSLFAIRGPENSGTGAE